MGELSDIKAHQFDSQTSRVARNLALEKARAEAEERRAAALMQAAVATQIITSQENALSANGLDIPKLMKQAAVKVAMEVITGRVQIRNGSDAASVVKALMEMGRLEAGESTSTHETLSPAEAAERAKALRDAAQKRLEEAEKAGELVRLPSG